MDSIPPNSSVPQPETLVIAGEKPQLGRMVKGQIIVTNLKLTLNHAANLPFSAEDLSHFS